MCSINKEACPATIVIATENAGKAREIAAILGEALPRTRFVRPSELDITVEYPPEGDNYHLNAQGKALAAARQTMLPAVADDSGLEVDALGGRPGAGSARYADNDAARIARLLEELRGVPLELRGARFRAVAAFSLPDRRTITAEATWEGRIALAPGGAGGFGYDPVFLDLGLGRTAAELSSAEKDARSHRGAAFRRLAALIIADTAADTAGVPAPRGL